MPANPTAQNLTARNPIRVPANRMPANARVRRRAAMATRRVHRASTGMTVPAATGRLPIVRRAAKARSARMLRAVTANFNREDRAPRSDGRPAGRFRTRNSATRSLIRRGTAIARSDPTRRAVKASARKVTGPAAIVPMRKFGGDKKFSRGAPDHGPRKDFGSRLTVVHARISASRARDRSDPGDRGDSKPWHKRDASSPDHAGRNSRPSRDGAQKFRQAALDKPRRR